MLYEVAIIQVPSQKEIENGEQEKLVLNPTAVIAKDESGAAVVAVMQNKDKISCDMSKVQVLVRPFGK